MEEHYQTKQDLFQGQVLINQTLEYNLKSIPNIQLKEGTEIEEKTWFQLQELMT